MDLFRSRAAVLQRAQSISQSDNSHSSESETSQRLSNYSPRTLSHKPAQVPLKGTDNGWASPSLAPPLYGRDTHGSRESLSIRSSDERMSRGGVRKEVPPMLPIPPRSSSRGRVVLDDNSEPQSIATVSRKRSPNRHFFLGSSRPTNFLQPSAYDLRGPRSATKASSPSSTRVSISGMRSPSTVLHLDGTFDHSHGETLRASEDTTLQARETRNAHSTIADPLCLNKTLPNTPPSSPSHQSIIIPKSGSTSPFHPPVSFRQSSYVLASAEEDVDSRFGRLSSNGDSQYLRYGHEYAYTPRSSSLSAGHSNNGQQSKRASWADPVHGSDNAESQTDDSDVWHQSSESHSQQHVGDHVPLPYSSSSTMTPAAGHFSALSSVTTLPTRLIASLRPKSMALSTRPPSISHSSHSTSFHSSEIRHLSHVPVASLSKVSFSKRLKRTFSFRSSSPPPLNGRSNTVYEEFGTIRSFRSESQIFNPQSMQAPRKLKKPRPLSISGTSTPPTISGRPRPNSALDSPYPHSTSTIGWSNLRTRSSPSRHGWMENPPPVPPLPIAFKGVPRVNGSQTPRQTTFEPIEASHNRRESISSRSDATLPPAISPPANGSTGSNFSQASRSRSTPNLWPHSAAQLSVLNTKSQGVSEVLPTQRLITKPTSSPPSTPPAERSQKPVSLTRISPSSESLSPKRHQSNRRWTLAASEIPDEQLVTELDRLRSVGWWLGPQGELIRGKGKGKPFAQKRETEAEQDTTREKADDEKWRVARQALMVCREIVRTEKSYREAMVRLHRGETNKGPPPLLLQYLPALISASQAFSERLNEDPSTWGVSAAFIGVEDVLETALVAWSGIVGEFFSARGSQHRRWSTGPGDKEKDKDKDKDKKAVTKAPVPHRMGGFVDGHDGRREVYSPIKSAPSTWRMSMPSLSQLLTPGSDGGHFELHKNQQAVSPSTPASVKTPTVQDLAIQPTQRVMRYVLLYKDLLNSTPAASPARPLVEHALESATRIAQRCNRAQDNAAFLT